MSSWTPEVVKIKKIEKHPNADNLSIATVMDDYQLIIKTGEFSVGQLAGYIPIDTIVPDNDLFYFLCPNASEKYEENGEIKTRIVGKKFEQGLVPEKFRIIKAKKIRGIYSQGLLLNVDGLKEGDSIVEYFLLKKWEEEEDDDGINYPVKSKGQIDPPKTFNIPYYDISNIKKYLNCLNENEEIILTEKLHGMNASFCHDGENIWSKSRRFFKKEDPEDSWWDIVYRFNLKDKLAEYPFMVFFGEIVGQQRKFRYDSLLEDGKLLTSIHFFDIYDSKTSKYLDYDDRIKILDSLKLNKVPELYRGPFLNKEQIYKYAEGKSLLNNSHIREGVVLVPLKERYDQILGRVQLKIISEAYNLQK